MEKNASRPLTSITFFLGDQTLIVRTPDDPENQKNRWKLRLEGSRGDEYEAPVNTSFEVLKSDVRALLSGRVLPEEKERQWPEISVALHALHESYSSRHGKYVRPLAVGALVR